MGSLFYCLKMIQLFFLAWGLLSLNTGFATTLALPIQGDKVGEIEYALPEAGETLSDVGLRYDLGYREMVRANPQVNPNMPLSPETRLRIPTQFKLPKGPRRGLVISLSAYRLFFFPKGDNVVLTYPVGIGRKGWATPQGVTTVTAKQVNPIWRPTAKIQAYAAKKGVLMPDAFPAGSRNPLGAHVLRLGWPAYLIHGSNQRDGIGDRVSAGCIRMLPEDIEYLFEFVTVGTSVRVVSD